METARGEIVVRRSGAVVAPEGCPEKAMEAGAGVGVAVGRTERLESRRGGATRHKTQHVTQRRGRALFGS